MNEIRKLYRQAWLKWGAIAQYHMVIEECAELIKALTKLDRAKGTNIIEAREQVIEEMVDVFIMVEQLQQQLFCYDIFEKKYKDKIERLKKLVENPNA